MNKKSFTKRVMALAISLIMVVGLMPIQAFAVSYSEYDYSTYDVSYRTQSKNNPAMIRYGLPDSSVGDFEIVDDTGNVEIYLRLNNGWYFEKWDTWFKGGQDRKHLSDPSYDESNPMIGVQYTFYNRGGGVEPNPIDNSLKHIIVDNLRLLYGDFKVTAVVRPILTVNAGEGIKYEISTATPTLTEELTEDLSSNQAAVVYGEDATISYTVDNKYVVTDVNASGTKTINIDKANNKVVLVGTEKPTSVGIHTRLKQQKVNFNANGGSGTMTQQTFEHSVAQALTANSFTRTGYTFAGWNTKSDGTGTGYSDKQSVSFAPANDGDSITLYAQWEEEPVIPSDYTVSFDANGGDAIEPITVTHGETYGSLPSSAVTGLSGGDSNWYLVDENGIVTDTKITGLSEVTQASDHMLFIKRNVLAPSVELTLSVPGGISDDYQYYIPENSARVLTAAVSNRNDQVLNYTYQWYKDGSLIEGETGATLTLAGNVADSGKYKVVVTATLKDGTGIIVTSDAASAEKELQVKILHQANTINYDANGGEGGPSSNYTDGTTATVSEDIPTYKNYIFQGWNTKADGTGESYEGGETYSFQNDNGNGGCTVVLYAQWKVESKTVTYMLDGEVFQTDTVEYGKDAVLPEIPQKDGYAGSWDHDGKNITADTVINAVYTINEYTITFMDENGVYKTLTVKHGEAVTMPEVPRKDGYTVTWDTTIEMATGNATVKAVYTKNTVSDSPQTGDNSHIALWIALLFISGASVIALSVYDKKRRTASFFRK